MDFSPPIPSTLAKRYQAGVEIIELLQRAGFPAYLAGGSVRDLLLGRRPKDFDIVTAATPDEIESLFPKTLPIGRQFGIVVVVHAHCQFEVATFRSEQGYSDRRRPDQVRWSDDRDDASRRDFTINALFFDPIAGQLIDYLDGLIDLEARVLRFVGDPHNRLQEDPLRILRAVRLKNSLGFQYEPATYQAIGQYAADVNLVSGERIRDELNRMLADPSRADSLIELAEFGILKAVLPEIDALRGVPQPIQYHKEGDVFDHTVAALRSLPKRTPTFLAWAVMCHDAGKAITMSYPKQAGERIRYDGHKTAGAELSRQIGVRLRMPRAEMETIAWLVDHHMSLVGIDKLREAKRRTYLLDPRFQWLLELHKADALGTEPHDLSLYRELRLFYAKYLALWKNEQKAGRPKPLVTGHDLQIELGMPEGKELGRILQKLNEAQLERTISTRAEALDLARQLRSR